MSQDKISINKLYFGGENCLIFGNEILIFVSFHYTVDVNSLALSPSVPHSMFCTISFILWRSVPSTEFTFRDSYGVIIRCSAALIQLRNDANFYSQKWMASGCYFGEINLISLLTAIRRPSAHRITSFIIFLSIIFRPLYRNNRCAIG